MFLSFFFNLPDVHSRPRWHVRSARSSGFKHDDVMRATHSVSVISHSLHDCIGSRTVCGRRTPSLTCRGLRWCRHRCEPADVDVVGSLPSSSPSPIPPPSSPFLPSPPPPPSPPSPPTPSIEKRSVLYAPAHTLYLACVLNADSGVSGPLSASTRRHAPLPPRRVVAATAACVRHRVCSFHLLPFFPLFLRFVSMQLIFYVKH